MDSRPPPFDAAHAPHPPARVTPLARRAARVLGLDLTSLAGSGRGGRVTRRDVERRLADAATAPAIGLALGAASMTSPTHSLAPAGPAVAAHPALVPTAWMLVEADLTPLLRAIARQAAAFRLGEGVDLTPLACIVQATALALRQHPSLNSAWAGTAIHQRRSITLAVAGPRAASLVIPRAEDLTLPGLARALVDPAADHPTAAPSFTIVAGGTPGPIAQPALPAGQAASLIAGEAARRLTAVGDTIAPRWIATLGVVFDHRVLDGAPVGHFLRAVRLWLEETGPAALNGR